MLRADAEGGAAEGGADTKRSGKLHERWTMTSRNKPPSAGMQRGRCACRVLMQREVLQREGRTQRGVASFNMKCEMREGMRDDERLMM